MSELEARFRVTLVGKEELRAFFVNSERQAKIFGAAVTTSLKSVNRELDRFAERIRRTPTDTFFTKSEEQAKHYTATLSTILGNASREMQQFRDQMSRPVSMPRLPRGARGGTAAAAAGEEGEPLPTRSRRLRAPSGKTIGELSATAAIQTGRTVYGAAADVIGAVAPDMGISSQISNVIEFRDRINEVGVSGGKSAERIAQLREEVLSAAKASNQFGKDAVDALGAFVAKTGELEIGIQNLQLYGRVATATTAEVKDVATIGADIALKMGVKSRGDQGTAFGILAKQADIGNVELKDMARYFSTMTAAFQSANLQGIPGIKQGGGLAQLFQTGTKSAAQTQTSIAATFSDLRAKQGRLGEMGINFDPNKANLIDVLRQLIVKTGGDISQLQLGEGGRGIFGREAIKGVQRAAALYREGRAAGGTGFEKWDEYVNAATEGKDIIGEKFAERTTTGAAAMKAAQIEVDVATQKNLGDSIEKMAKSAPKVADAFAWFTKNPLLGGTAIAGGLFAKNLLFEGARSGIRGVLGGGTGVVGDAVARAAGAKGTRVEVTNWPAGFGLSAGAGEAGSAAGGAATGGILGWVTKALSSNVGTLLKGGAAGVATVAGGVAGAGAAGYATGSILDEWLDLSGRLEKSISDITGNRQPIININVDKEGNVKVTDETGADIEASTRSLVRMSQRRSMGGL